MAEQQHNDRQPLAKKKKGVPVKTILILVGVLLAEAATVLVVFMIASKPSPVMADDPAQDLTVLMEKPAETLVIEGKFPNSQRGRTILFDTEVYVIVKTKHLDSVQAMVEEKKARIGTDIKTIISRADPSHFAEPAHATLTRQIRDVMDKRIGRDPEDNELIVQEVLIKQLTGFDASF